MVDNWYLTSSFSVPTGPTTIPQTGKDVTVGSSMTESSGIFTFPSTGVYLFYQWRF